MFNINVMRRTADSYQCLMWFAGSVLPEPAKYLPRKYSWPTHSEFYIKYLSMHDCEFDSDVWFNEQIRTGQSCDSEVGTNIQFYCSFQQVSFLWTINEWRFANQPFAFYLLLFKSGADNIYHYETGEIRTD